MTDDNRFRRTTATRRNILKGAALISAAGISSASAARSEFKTFVLVHGAWHGGWCWRRVADLLEKQGHKVFTPTLTGLGERSHLLSDQTNLATHIDDIVNVIKWEGLDDVVLCGHSYAGYVVAGVAERIRSKIVSIIFLDAFLPRDGDNLASSSERLANMVRSLESKKQMAVPPIPAEVFNVNVNDRAWVDGQCTPQPLLTFTDRIALTGEWERIAKKTYVRARGYPTPTFDEAASRIKDDASWMRYELSCGHDAMLDMPDRVAEILIQRA